jgi:hypothetical protein
VVEKPHVCDPHHIANPGAALDALHAKGRSPMTPELFLLALGLALWVAGMLAAPEQDEIAASAR